MTTRVTRLSRLSRNKTTGNIIIGLAIIIGTTFIINGVITGVSSNIDKILIIFGVILCLYFSYIVNKRLRKPFFSEYSNYFDELGDRRLKIQKTAVLVDLIEPLQTLVSLNTVLIQLDELQKEIENLIKLSSSEFSLSSSIKRTPMIQETLNAIIKFGESIIIQIREKRDRVIYFANIRKIVFNSIKKQIRRPRNEIETEYLRYKVEKTLFHQNQIIEDQLVQQILDHALDHREIIGQLERDNNGDSVLSIDRLPEYTEANEKRISWNVSELSEDQCIICRHTIQYSETSVNCPSCGNPFHHNHLLEWLKVFGHCPICHQKINFVSNAF